MIIKINWLLFLTISFMSFSCDNEYSKYKIQNDPVFDEEYYKASLESIEESIKMNPKDAEGYFKKALVLTKIDKNKEAEKAIEKAIELENNAEFFLLATQLYLNNDDQEKALNAALMAEKAGLNNGWLFSIIANLKLLRGDSVLAFDYMEKAIASNPQNPVNYINRGNLLLNIKDTSRAIESFDLVLELDSMNADVLTILTDINLAKHQYKRAETLISKKVEYHQMDQKTQRQLAYLLWKTGKYDSALHSFKNIIENDPSDYNAYNYISLIEYQKKQYDSAVWYAEKTLSLKSDEKVAMLTLARVKDIKRQYFSALVQYDKIITLDPNYLIAIEERARIQKKINNLAHERKQERTPVLPQIQQRF